MYQYFACCCDKTPGKTDRGKGGFLSDTDHRGREDTTQYTAMEEVDEDYLLTSP